MKLAALLFLLGTLTCVSLANAGPIPEDGKLTFSGVVSNGVFVGEVIVTGEKAAFLARKLELPRVPEILDISVVIDLARGHTIQIASGDWQEKWDSTSSRITSLSGYVPRVEGPPGATVDWLKPIIEGVPLADQANDVIPMTQGKDQLEELVGHSLGEFRTIQQREVGPFLSLLFGEKTKLYSLYGLRKLYSLYWEPHSRRVFRIDDPQFPFPEESSPSWPGAKDLWASRRIVTIYSVPEGESFQNSSASPLLRGSIKTLGYHQTGSYEAVVKLGAGQTLYLTPPESQLAPHITEVLADGTVNTNPLLALDEDTVSARLKEPLGEETWVPQMTASRHILAESLGVYKGFEILDRLPTITGYLLVRVNESTLAIMDTTKTGSKQWVQTFPVRRGTPVEILEEDDTISIKIPSENQNYIFRQSYVNLMRPTLNLETYSALSEPGILSCDAKVGNLGARH